MNCPFCLALDTKVVDSRLNQDGNTIRRRRKCDKCEKRFTTYEHIELEMPQIIKNDGRREAFSRIKMKEGLSKACQKRPISMDQIEAVLDRVEKIILDCNEKEISTKNIGLLMMQELKSLDPVAYVRFASVYRTFKDIEEFIGDLKLDHANHEFRQ